jgi:hypothetical protein
MAAAALIIAHPDASEHAPYYSRYTTLVPDDDILAFLEQQGHEFPNWLSALAEAQGDLRYGPGKWSVKEVIGHINDTERIMSYRALRIGRNDATPIEGFEQDDYVRDGGFSPRRMSDLMEEFRAIRGATLSLLRSFDAGAWERRGTANKNPISVRALAYVMGGHVVHHRNVLHEKYLSL